MRNWQALLLLVAVAISPISNAADGDEVALLKAQLTALQARLDRLEARASVPTENLSAPGVPTPPAPPASSWTDKIKLKGDLRYRHEGFEIENRRDRHRQRVRVRTALIAQVDEDVEVGFGLASGGSDPISTNQTLGNGSSSKSVVIDLAYVNWKTAVDGLAVTAGKFKNPFHRAGGHSLVWDGDLNPEGLALKYSHGSLFASVLGSWVAESSSDDDSYLLGAQIGARHNLGDGKLVAGVGYYNYLDTRGEPVFFDGDSRGNRLDANGNYLNGFELVEAFVEYAFPVGDSTVTLFGDYVQNTAASRYDTGYALGAALKVANGAKFTWAYQELEADAVLGLFTDSDFIGGGTDGEGHVLSASYPLASKISLKGTLFLNDRNMDFGTEESFKRLMLDISFKY